MNDWFLQQETKPATLYVFSMTLIGSKKFIGLIGLKMGKPNYRLAELWYKLNPDHWRKGYASEAVKAILTLCFDKLNLHRIEAGCAVDNTSSIRVLEKSGFIKEGRKRAILPIREEWVDNYIYAILENDFNH